MASSPDVKGADVLPVEAGAIPVTVSLVADEVRLADRNLNKVVLGASRAGPQWLVNVERARDKRIPHLERHRRDNGQVDGATGAAGDSEFATGGTRRFAIDRTHQPAGDGHYGGAIHSGRAGLRQARTRRAQCNWSCAAIRSRAQPAAAPCARQLERLRLVTPSAELEANGEWDRATSLTYKLNISDAGGFLNRLQLKDVVKGGAGSLAGELHWNGSPFSLDLPSFAERHGRNRRAQWPVPQGRAGRRQADRCARPAGASEAAHAGFQGHLRTGIFLDELRGSVAILDGIARTESLAMRGLQAVVQIKGQADLKASTQDLKVVVVPRSSTAALPRWPMQAIVNPAIGLGAFLAQSLFSQPLSRALAHEIEITGSWSDPTVVERKRERFQARPRGNSFAAAASGDNRDMQVKVAAIQMVCPRPRWPQIWPPPGRTGGRSTVNITVGYFNSWREGSLDQGDGGRSGSRSRAVHVRACGGGDPRRLGRRRHQGGAPNTR